MTNSTNPVAEVEQEYGPPLYENPSGRPGRPYRLWRPGEYLATQRARARAYYAAARERHRAHLAADLAREQAAQKQEAADS